MAKKPVRLRKDGKPDGRAEANRRSAARHRWYAEHFNGYECLNEMPDDFWAAATFPLLQARVEESLRNNEALLRRLKRKGTV